MCVTTLVRRMATGWMALIGLALAGCGEEAVPSVSAGPQPAAKSTPPPKSPPGVLEGGGRKLPR